MRKRNVGIYFRISDEEADSLDDILEASNLSMAEFMRYTLFGYPKPPKRRISKTVDTVHV